MAATTRNVRVFRYDPEIGGDGHFDSFKLVPIRHHKTLAWSLPVAGLIALFLIWRSIY